MFSNKFLFLTTNRDRDRAGADSDHSVPLTMAGAGQPWYMPVTWPLGHVSTALSKADDDKPPKPSAAPYLDLTGNLTAMAAAARSWTLAYLCIYYLPGENCQQTERLKVLT